MALWDNPLTIPGPLVNASGAAGLLATRGLLAFLTRPMPILTEGPPPSEKPPAPIIPPGPPGIVVAMNAVNYIPPSGVPTALDIPFGMTRPGVF